MITYFLKGDFFSPFPRNKLDFVCVSSLSVLSDWGHVAEQEKATSEPFCPYQISSL